jgi:hypothetical protein
MGRERFAAGGVARSNGGGHDDRLAPKNPVRKVSVTIFVPTSFEDGDSIHVFDQPFPNLEHECRTIDMRALGGVVRAITKAHCSKSPPRGSVNHRGTEHAD